MEIAAVDTGVAVGLGLLALVAFFLFVRRDQRRLRSRDLPPNREALERGEPSGASLRPLAFLGIALLAASLAAMQWLNPQTSRSTGRWSLLWNTLHDALGMYGPALLTSVLAAGFAWAAAVSWKPRSRSGQAKAD